MQLQIRNVTLNGKPYFKITLPDGRRKHFKLKADAESYLKGLKGTHMTPEPTEGNATPVGSGDLVSTGDIAKASEALASEATPVSPASLVTDGQQATPDLPGMPSEPPPPIEPPPGTRKARGRPRGSKSAPKFDDIEATAAAAIEPPKPPVNYEAMSAAVFDMGTSCLTMGFGPEWQPQSPEERAMVTGALKVYFETKQTPDLPPGLMLTFVLVAYSVPRLKAQPTSSKLRRGWQWLRSKLRRKAKPLSILPPTQPTTENQHDNQASN